MIWTGASAGVLGAVLAVAIPQGCGSSDDTTTTTSGGSTSSAGGKAAGGSGGGMATTTSTGGGNVGGGQMGGFGGFGGFPGDYCDMFDGLTMAIDKLYLGDRTFVGQTSAVAWKDYGFNLDNLVTTNDFSMVCKPYSGGTTASFEDGTNGRDNSFGRNVRPILETLVMSLDDQANQAIASGTFTEIFAFEKLGMEADKDPLVTSLYGGAPLGNSPVWKGKDCWPVVPEDLNSPKDIKSAKVFFTKSKLVANVWDSNGKADLILPLNVLGQSVPVHLYQARMTVKLAGPHDGAALGQIGGFVKTEEFVQTVRQAAGAINAQYCQLFDSQLADQLRRASDIMDDGTQDPNKTCNAISVGIGFTLYPVQFGKIGPASPPPMMPCK